MSSRTGFFIMIRGWVLFRRGPMFVFFARGAILGGVSAGIGVWFFARGLRGRDFGKPVNALIPSRKSTDRKPDEPEHEENLARSLFVLPKHARNKFRGLAAEIETRIQKGLNHNFPRNVSRGTLPEGRDFIFSPNDFCSYGSGCMSV